MHRSIRMMSCVIAICAASGTAAAQGRPEAPAPNDAINAATDASCQYVRAVAASTSALLLSPQVFVSGGMIAGSDSSGGGAATPAIPRLMAGLSYSASNAVRGLETRKLAEAECARAHEFNSLLAFVFVHRDGASPVALDGKLRVLEEAKPRVERLVAQARTAFAENRITGDEMLALLSKADGVAFSIEETRGRSRAALGNMKAPDASLSELLARRDARERESEAHQAALRQAQAWDVSVRGGYDQAFGVRQPVPMFGMLTVTLNPGYFWQRSPDTAAVQARGAVSRTSLEAPSERATDLARQLREVLVTERSRLVQVTALVDELSTRLREIEAVEGDRARTIADNLWLTLVPLRADRAYLTLHTEALARVLGSDTQDGRKQ
jgi:hypothetical protein